MAVRAPARRSLPSSPSAPEGPTRVQVPKTNKEPVLSLCPWSVEVILGACQDDACTENHMFEIPALPASEWLQYLLSTETDLNSLISGLLPELEDFFFDNALPIDEMYEQVLDIIEHASARSWWVTLRLISVAAQSWEILGPRMIISGVDATKVSLAAWLDVLLFLIIESMDPKDITMFTMKLEIPPQSVLESGEEPEMTTDRDAFLAFGN